MVLACLVAKYHRCMVWSLGWLFALCLVAGVRLGVYHKFIPMGFKFFYPFLFLAKNIIFRCSALFYRCLQAVGIAPPR